MKYALMFMLAFVFGNIEAKEISATYDTKIIKVVDGDTIAVKADWLPDPLKKEIHVRIFGVDTPEKGAKAKCTSEAELGAKASAFTKQLVTKSKKQQYVLIKWDKYGGRVIGDILLDDKSLRQALLTNGLAKEYYGGTKESWCAK